MNFWRILNEFRVFELPLLVGVSRKSMIYRLLGNTPQDALNGTTVLDTICLLKGQIFSGYMMYAKP